MRIVVTTVIAWAVFGLALPSISAQDPPPKKPYDHYKSARDLIFAGKYDLAAEELKAFTASNPSDADYLEIERKFGADTFLKLKRVLKWDDNPTADAEAKKLVDDVIAKSIEASKRLSQDAGRLAKFVRNLGASAAEREFATDQLKLAGAAAVPVLMTELRSTNENNLKAGIFSAIPQLPAETVPGMLASLDGLTDDSKAHVIQAIAKRPDVLKLIDQAETDFTPYLWYYSESPTPVLKVTAASLLDTLTAGASTRTSADAELVRLTEPFIRHTARFATLDNMTNKVKVWVWDPATLATKVQDVLLADAEEYHGLRRLRWAIERNSQSDSAQTTYLALATERAVLRSKFGDLSKSEPAVYRLLAAAPPSQLFSLLQTALSEKRTALAYGLLRGMGDRGLRDTTTTTGAKVSPYTTALAYPDTFVQFAAAVAILRAPGESSATSRARVVEVLQRALLADIDGAATGKTGRAIIADPSGPRGEKVAATFRDIGYAAERFATGQELLRRISKRSDFDLIVIDRHIADPTLRDVLGQLNADPNSGKRPILVVASTASVKPVPVEMLLLRLALLVAATETADDLVVPAPYVFDPRMPDPDRVKAREENVKTRDTIIEALAKLRIQRLQRLVEAADLPSDRSLADRLNVRVPQLTYTILAAEYAVNQTSAPQAAKKVDDLGTLIKSMANRDNPLERIKDAETLNRILEQLEVTLDAPRRTKFEELQKKVSPESLSIATGALRDEELEQKLAKQLRTFASVSVVPEVYSAVGLADDVKSSTSGQSQQPIPSESRLVTAKLAAEWLRKLATGEVPGYDAKPAEAALRTALRSDELAPDAIDALTKLGSGDTQLGLVQLAIDTNRPVPVRTRAADAAARHIQQFGNQTTAMILSQVAQAASGEADLTLKGKLLIIASTVVQNAKSFADVLKNHPINVTAPVTPAPPKATDTPATPAVEPKK